MAKASRSSAPLPEPQHPFARWFGGAIVSLWAVGVQSFADPWNKMGAILSPGLGYVAGQGLEKGLDWLAAKSNKRRHRLALADIDNSIQQLNDARASAGASASYLELVDEALKKAHQQKIEILSHDLRL